MAHYTGTMDSYYDVTEADMKPRASTDAGGPDTSKSVEESLTKKPKVQPWLQGRLALSQQSSRFELPMDLKVLEKLHPQEYLRDFVVITSRRLALYQRVFARYKDKFGHITLKELEKSLKDVLVNTITADDLKNLYDLVMIEETSKVDYKLFCGIAALAERILFHKFLTDDTRDIPDHKKEKIECADFCGLEWKFHGINVNPAVKKILQSL